MSNDSTRAKAHFDLAQKHYNNCEFDKAIEEYTEVIRLDPNNAAAYNNRGNAFADKGNYDKAINDSTQAILLDPNNPVAYYNRGETHFEKGDYNKAIVDFEAALRIWPKSANIVKEMLQKVRQAQGWQQQQEKKNE